MNHKIIHVIFFLLGCLSFVSCSDDDDNPWRDENESIFERIGEESVVLPRDRIIYSQDTVIQKTINETILPSDVVKDPSGIKYRILHKSGKTQKPYFTSKVKVHYEGRRIDGTIFDSTYDKDSTGPMTTLVKGSSVSDIIRGWTEALQLMAEGDIFEIYIPWELGYGNSDSGSIKAYTTLVFIMELVEITDL